MFKNIMISCVLIAASTSAFAASQATNPCQGKNAGDKVSVTTKNGKTATIVCKGVSGNAK